MYPASKTRRQTSAHVSVTIIARIVAVIMAVMRGGQCWLDASRELAAILNGIPVRKKAVGNRVHL
jgi:hypothetical protein